MNNLCCGDICVCDFDSVICDMMFKYFAIFECTRTLQIKICTVWVMNTV